MIQLPYDRVIFDNFAESLCVHIRYVREAGEQIGVLKSRLLAHDHSKWSAEEFSAYAWNFFGGDSDKLADPSVIKNAFAEAWLHHIHHNDHHWQHWLFPDRYSLKGSSVENGAIEMPQPAALEMIADWIGASRAYTGSCDMADWLTKNIPGIRLHSRTANYVRGVLDTLGYADIVYAVYFADERP